MVREAVSRVGRHWIVEELGIVRCEYFPGSDCSLADAKESLAALKKLCEGKRYPLLCDLSNLRSADQETRDYFGSEEGRSAYSAMAIIGGTPMGAAIGSIWVAVHASEGTPIAFIATEAEAIEWLKQFRT